MTFEASTVPSRFNPVLNIVERWAREEPEAQALVSIGAQGELVKSQTTGDLARESRRMARALLALGVAKGDRVLVMMSRLPAWYTAMLGTLRLGAVAIPTPNQCTERDVAYRISSAEPVAVIADESAAARIGGIAIKFPSVRHWIVWSEREARQPGWYDLDTLLDESGNGPTPDDPTSANDPLLTVFTSGTASYPKMVLQRQSYALGHVTTARDWHGIGRGDEYAWYCGETRFHGEAHCGL
jgi:acetyl-CoA synthetase